MTRSEAGEIRELRESVIRMEEQNKAHGKEQAELKVQMQAMQKDIQDIKDILTQAKGARWVILGVTGLIGGALSAKFAAFVQFLTAR